MIKTCFLVLTLATGQPALVNIKDIMTINQGQVSAFGTENTKIYFNSAVLNPSLSIKETVDEVLLKMEQCQTKFEPKYFFIGK